MHQRRRNCHSYTERGEPAITKRGEGHTPKERKPGADYACNNRSDLGALQEVYFSSGESAISQQVPNWQVAGSGTAVLHRSPSVHASDLLVLVGCGSLRVGALRRCARLIGREESRRPCPKEFAAASRIGDPQFPVPRSHRK